MTTDIARMETTAVATLNGASDALARLGEWVEAARHAHQLVAPLVGTAFVPDSYKPKVDPRATDKEKAEAREVAVANATAAVLQGITLGLDPMTALQQIYIVHGRPGMYAKMMVALVQAHGHEVWTEDLSDTRAVVGGRRKGSDIAERITVTMQQARTAGWTRNDNYAKTPQDMLWARAASRVCDRIASDVLKGIASIEAVQDELAPTNGNGTRTVTPRKRVAAVVGRPEPAAEPPLDVEGTWEREAAGEAEEPTLGEPEEAEPITTAQQRKLHALLRDKGLGNRDAGLRAISMILEHPVGSTKEMTKADAMTVIDRLEDLPEAADAEPTLDEPGGEP
jgi:hypothetical protein